MRSSVLVFLILVCPGCSTMRYLAQAGKGQLAIMNHARPIEEVIRDARTSERVRTLLAQLPPMKVYAGKQGLQATNKYSEYVDLRRPYVNWVLVACEQLAFKPKEWSFPIVGKIPYLGWFDENVARREADALMNEGYDVYLRGSRAYSTLGWFKDPVLSSMIGQGDEALGELANVLFHESVHATIYFKGQWVFNESVASFIADRMTLEYLRTLPDQKPRESYAQAVSKNEKLENKFHEAYEDLKQLYASAEPAEEKFRRKKERLKKLQDELDLKREINNALLVGFKTYRQGKQEFERLFNACGGDWKKFIQTLHKQVSADRFTSTQQEDLGPVIPQVCSG